MNTQTFHYPTITIPALKKSKTVKHNEYRTQRLVLEACDREVILEESAAATK